MAKTKNRGEGVTSISLTLTPSALQELDKQAKALNLKRGPFIEKFIRGELTAADSQTVKELSGEACLN